MGLFTKISEVQQYIRVGNALDIRTLTPSLNEVEMHDLRFYLGGDLLDIIKAESALEPSVRIAKILPYVKSALANLAVYKGGPEIEVLVSDNGILRQETANEKTAFGGQVKRFLDMAADRGYKAIDHFLTELENNVVDYPEWLESDFYKQKRGLLISSAKQFEEAGESLKSSALTFQALRPIILDIQEQRISQALPEALFVEIIGQIEAGTVSVKNKFLLTRYLRPALAKLVVEEALTMLPIEIDHEGVTVNQLLLSGSGDARTKTSAPIHLIEKKAWGLRGRGEFYLSNMKEYLNQKASEYPLWAESDHYSETLKQKIEKNSLIPEERKIFRT